ncbi:MAG: hypothetical protein CM1200mP2_35300 [Planctomycetaceae bacterium]|nr:MAG: hypothetical protein CM1200mP2_35300 [Planctomycetaceae bacterium]
MIADVRPGIYGARGKLRTGGVLGDLFGVKHTGSAPVSEKTGSIKGILGRSPVNLKRRTLFVNPNLSITTGKALGKAGDTPICIVNQTGRGRAVLLNFTMWSYAKLAVHEGNDDAVAFFRTLFAEAGATPPLGLEDSAGRRHRNIEAMRWRTGHGTQVIALHGPTLGTWPEPNGGTPDPPPEPFSRGLDTGVPVVVRFAEPRYVHELRTGRHSDGLTRTFKTSATAFTATLLVASSRPFHAPILSVVTDSARRGQALGIRVAIPGHVANECSRSRPLIRGGKNPRLVQDQPYRTGRTSRVENADCVERTRGQGEKSRQPICLRHGPDRECSDQMKRSETVSAEM